MSALCAYQQRTGLALHKRPRSGTRRPPRPARSRLEPGLSIGRVEVEVLLVRCPAIEGRVRPALIVPRAHAADFTPEGIATERKQGKQSQQLLRGVDHRVLRKRNNVENAPLHRTGPATGKWNRGGGLLGWRHRRLSQAAGSRLDWDDPFIVAARRLAFDVFQPASNSGQVISAGPRLLTGSGSLRNIGVAMTGPTVVRTCSDMGSLRKMAQTAT